MKLNLERGHKEYEKSLPVWECGLKYAVYEINALGGASLPVWECGLKYFYQPPVNIQQHVTPCVGVWIEICSV